jgi:hypothetical protein
MEGKCCGKGWDLASRTGMDDGDFDVKSPDDFWHSLGWLAGHENAEAVKRRFHRVQAERR